jgi:hypothetical protein
MTFQLTPETLNNATGGQPQLAGSTYPDTFSSNQVGGYNRRRTYKKFMRGKKSYKNKVRKYMSSSSGLFSRLLRKMKGSRKR